jgi:inositol oxygenase
VNVLKGHAWDEKTGFADQKDKVQFRQYEAACDRVKAFYKEQHGADR